MRRYAVAALSLAAVLVAVGVAYAATTYTADISVTNSNSTAQTDLLLDLGVTGAGLDDFTDDLRKVEITDDSDTEALVEASADTREWRLLVPSVAANTSEAFTLTIDDTDTIDAFGCGCWAQAAHDPAAMDPGASAMDMSATVYVEPESFSQSDDLGDSRANQWTSSRRMTVLNGYYYLATVEGQNAKVYLSTDGSTWTSQGSVSFTSPDFPQAVAVASANGYVHVAIYIMDTTNNHYGWYYVRGTQNADTGALSLGTAVEIFSQGTGTSSADPENNGVAITLTGTRYPTVIGVYGFDSSGTWDDRLTYMRSTVSDNYSTSSDVVATTNLASGTGANATIHVDAVGWPSTEVFVVWSSNTQSGLESGTLDSAGTYTAATAIDSSSGIPVSFSVYGDTDSTDAYVLWEDGTPVKSAHWDGTTLTTGTVDTLGSATTYVSLSRSSQYLTPWTGESLVAYYKNDDGDTQRKVAELSAPNTWYDLPDIADTVDAAYITTPLDIGPWSDEDEALGLVTTASTFDIYAGKVPPRGHSFFWLPGSYGFVVDTDLTARAWTYTGGVDEVTWTTTAGRHTYRLTYDGATLEAFEDGTSQASAAASGSVSASTDDLVVSYGFPMTKDASFTIAASEKQRWYGALQADSTAPAGYKGVDLLTGNTAAVQEFHATDSVAGVSVTNGALKPASTATAGGTSAEPTPTVPLTPPATPEGLYDETGGLSFPGGDLITDVVNNTDWPIDFISGTLTMAFAAFVVIGVFWITRSMLWSAIGGDVLLWFSAFTTTLPEWVPIAGLVVVVALWLVERRETA